MPGGLDRSPRRDPIPDVGRVGQFAHPAGRMIRYSEQVLPPPVVFLVGFMGCGKSSVGRLVASRLGLPFIDLDERVVAGANAPIHEIFAREGEPAFRGREHAALTALEPELADGAVVATGGGTATDAELRRWMLQRGAVIWLDATLEDIEKRVVRDGSRPLFGERTALERLYSARRPAYESFGQRLDTSGRTLDQVVELVTTLARRPGMR
jgi:shikimate kinase